MSFFRKVSDSESESESEEELMSDSENEGEEKKTTTTNGAAAPRKSAFLRSGNSDSSDDDSDDDESDDDSDEDSDEDDDAPAARKQSRFLRGADDDSDSDEEEVKKVIKSAREKRVDEMDAVAKSIENAQRIGDWVAISKEFDSLNRLSDRMKVVNEPTPPIYLKTLSTLENYLSESLAREKSAEKKMKVPNARAMNAMKQRIKKVTADNEAAIASYKADPEAFEANYTAATAPVAAPVQPKKAKKSVAIDGAEGEEDDEFQTVGRGGKAVTYTSEGLFKSLAAVMEARGRKSTDRSEQIEILTKLMAVAASSYQKIRVLLALLAARFDYNQSAAAYMNAEQWTNARKEVQQLIKVLTEDRTYQVAEQTADYDDEIDRQPNQNGEGPVVEVRGSVTSFVERLDDEFTKCLQHVDPHTTEYIERLSDEKLLYRTIIMAQNYFETVEQPGALSRTMMRRLDHIYAKPDNIIQALEAAAANAEEGPLDFKSGITPSSQEASASADGASALIRSLCVSLYKTTGFETERLRTRAMLYHIYHHALRRDYHIARDMFLMSHLQDSIGMADAATQILYNRVVVQLGICAFRVGLIRESQGALQEIFASTRVKELLAQGTSLSRSNPTVTPEQEKLERQRQLPFHMHINLELLECIYLVSSMLLEIPNIAHTGEETDQRRNFISRTFRKMLDYTDRQVFSGPAESTRDHVMAAAKALQNGNWKESQEQVAEIKIWKLMVDHEEVIAMLRGKIQEEGLRTYLFTYSHFYKSLSLRHLADMFDLPVNKVKSIVSRMIWNEELQASLDIGSTGAAVATEDAAEGSAQAAAGEHGFVVLHGVQLSKVQSLAQQLAEKANILLEQNERSLDAKLGDRAGGAGGDGRGGGQDREGREGGRDGAGRREGRRGGGAGRGRGRGRGRAQFNALPGQQTV